MEVWKNVVEYEGVYEVSNLGNVRRIFTNHTRMLKPILTHNGYYNISLCRDSKVHSKRLHRIVAEAFIDNVENLPVINHKDEDKLNNKASNLEWCSVKYNTNYGTGLSRGAQKRNKPIYQYDKDRNFIQEWKSLTEASNAGYSAGNISQCCNGKRKYHKNYIWCYK